MVVTFEVITLDVWGNERDGFEVNQSFTTGITFDIDNEANDTDIEAKLKAIDVLADHAEIYVEGENDFMLNIYSKETGRPLIDLQPRTGD